MIIETVVFINISTTSLFLFTLKGLKLKPSWYSTLPDSILGLCKEMRLSLH